MAVACVDESAGEMGGTVMSYPASYLKVYNMIRNGWRSPAKLRVGATFNHAYIMGHITRGPGAPPVLPPSPMAAYEGGGGPVLPFEQWRRPFIQTDDDICCTVSEHVSFSTSRATPFVVAFCALCIRFAQQAQGSDSS